MKGENETPPASHHARLDCGLLLYCLSWIVPPIHPLDVGSDNCSLCLLRRINAYIVDSEVSRNIQGGHLETRPFATQVIFWVGRRIQGLSPGCLPLAVFERRESLKRVDNLLTKETPKRRTSRSRGMPSASEITRLAPVFTFACSSYPCSGFPETRGVLITHRPFGSRNSSPMAKPSLCASQ